MKTALGDIDAKTLEGLVASMLIKINSVMDNQRDYINESCKGNNYFSVHLYRNVLPTNTYSTPCIYIQDPL